MRLFVKITLLVKALQFITVLLDNITWVLLVPLYDHGLRKCGSLRLAATCNLDLIWKHFDSLANHHHVMRGHVVILYVYVGTILLVSLGYKMLPFCTRILIWVGNYWCWGYLSILKNARQATDVRLSWDSKALLPLYRVLCLSLRLRALLILIVILDASISGRCSGPHILIEIIWGVNILSLRPQKLLPTSTRTSLNPSSKLPGIFAINRFLHQFLRRWSLGIVHSPNCRSLIQKLILLPKPYGILAILNREPEPLAPEGITTSGTLHLITSSSTANSSWSPSMASWRHGAPSIYPPVRRSTIAQIVGGLCGDVGLYQGGTEVVRLEVRDGRGLGRVSSRGRVVAAVSGCGSGARVDLGVGENVWALSVVMDVTLLRQRLLRYAYLLETLSMMLQRKAVYIMHLLLSRKLHLLVLALWGSSTTATPGSLRILTLASHFSILNFW